LSDDLVAAITAERDARTADVSNVRNAVAVETAARIQAITVEANARTTAITNEANARLQADTLAGDLRAALKTELDAAIINHDADIQATQSDIDAAKLKAEQLYRFTQQMLTALRTEVRTRSNSATAAITANKQSIESNDQDISAIQATNAAQDSSIATNRQSIESNDQDISAIQATNAAQDSSIAANTALITTFGVLKTNGTCEAGKAIITSEDCQMLSRTNIIIGVWNSYEEDQYIGVAPKHARGMSLDGFCEDGWDYLHEGGETFNRYGTVWDEFCDWATVTLHPYPAGCFRIGGTAGAYFNAGGTSVRECSEAYPCICKA
jgi:hypothetical protein